MKKCQNEFYGYQHDLLIEGLVKPIKKMNLVVEKKISESAINFISWFFLYNFVLFDWQVILILNYHG